jgi:hypothetical protein
MKTSDVQKLPLGTKVYLIHFEVVAMLGQVSAEVIECEVRENDHGPGQHVAKRRTWRNRTSWWSVHPGHCYLERKHADQKLEDRLAVLRQKLNELAGIVQ